MRKMHCKDTSVLLPCDQCDKRFITKFNLENHKKVHLPIEERQRFSCLYCDHSCITHTGLAQHVKSIHIGEKPYVCEECGMSFVTNGALKEHKVVHSDDRPFECPTCLKRFKSLPCLKIHQDSHTGTQYCCPLCGKKLNTKLTLKKHMIVHSDEKKYKCQQCGDEFKRAKTLKNHLIMHTGLHAYSCPFCDRTFVNGSNCLTHKLRMHPEEYAVLKTSGLEQQVLLPKLKQLQPT